MAAEWKLDSFDGQGIGCNDKLVVFEPEDCACIFPFDEEEDESGDEEEEKSRSSTLAMARSRLNS